MIVYAGLNISPKHKSVCVVDKEGIVLLERKVLSEPRTVEEALRSFARNRLRLGIQACSNSTWQQREPMPAPPPGSLALDYSIICTLSGTDIAPVEGASDEASHASLE
jgi:hypothetical protein